MKLKEKSIKSDSNINNKFDFSKNYSLVNHNNDQNSDTKIVNNYKDDLDKINVDPRLELTLKYLDIMNTLNIFINNYISFNDLLLLSKKDLIELGFSLVERNRIFTFSQEYKNFGVKFNISEINDFFNKYENLNISLVTNNNYNKYNIKTKENINDNINHNYINNNKKNNNNHHDYNDLLLEKNYINKNSDKKKSKTKNIIIQKPNNISSSNNNNNNYTSIKSKTSFPSTNSKPKDLNNHYQSQDSNYQDTIHTVQNNNNNNNLQNSSKLIRQNSKVSKNSNYSKSSKSHLVTVSKILGGGSGSIIQKYQNISEEIDNYFKKYNDYKEQKKNRMKKYEILGTSNKRKNHIPINIEMPNDNKIDENVGEENISKNREDEINRRLIELQKRKKELKEKLNSICEKENKKLMIIKYLEEEDK